jgi:ATP phosphoribosyltransferase regulatory subunit
VWDRVGDAGFNRHLLVDMGEVRPMEYYTGLVFDMYADGIGGEIGGGGRYDHLIGRFGREVPSTGFALDLDRLLQLSADSPAGRVPAASRVPGRAGTKPRVFRNGGRARRRPV